MSDPADGGARWHPACAAFPVSYSASSADQNHGMGFLEPPLPMPEPRQQKPISVRDVVAASSSDLDSHPERSEGGASRIALIDGSNVAHAGAAKALLRNINLVRDKLIAEGMKPIVVADAALRHHIDENERYERMVDRGEIRPAPAGTDADYFLLSFARELDAAIVSNDRFSDLADGFPDARDRIIRYMIVADEVVLERRARRRE